MKHSELRIGNLIKLSGKALNYSDQPVVVSHFDRQVVFIEGAWAGEYYEHIEGVALSPEWLERAGFTGNIDEGFGLDVIELSYIVSDDYFQFEYKTPYSPWMLVHVRYVHQLQNLYFALTSEELTIK